MSQITENTPPFALASQPNPAAHLSAKPSSRKASGLSARAPNSQASPLLATDTNKPSSLIAELNDALKTDKSSVELECAFWKAAVMAYHVEEGDYKLIAEAAAKASAALAPGSAIETIWKAAAHAASEGVNANPAAWLDMKHAEEKGRKLY